MAKYLTEKYPKAHFAFKRQFGKKPIDLLWPFDGAHPDDAGYEVFFEAVRLGYEAAVKENM